MILCVILVITLQALNFNIFIKRRIHITTTFDIKLKICKAIEHLVNKQHNIINVNPGTKTAHTIKGLLAVRFIVNISALNVIDVMTFK